MLRPFAITPDVRPVKAFPIGKPISPSHDPLPRGPKKMPGKIPTNKPEKNPMVGPPKIPAIKAPTREKSNATPGEIGPA